MANREEPPGLQIGSYFKSGASSDTANDLGGLNNSKFIRVRESDALRASYDLAENLPHCSATRGLSKVQWVVLVVATLASVIFSIVSLEVFLQSSRVLLVSIFLFAICFRGLLLITHFWSKAADKEVATRHNCPDILPIYTLLLPVYKEAKILPELVKAINLLDYPTDRLDVKLLLEADDEETLSIAAELKLGDHWQVLIVPDIGPRTKPKALNVGLARAKGSFVTIYDAEDRPAAGQLRAAIAAFAKDTGKMACVQAPLGYYNAKQNWLTKQFALEYNAQFRVIIPALVRLGIAFPLGGTSNHFRRAALEETRGWDPFNVTEDADLGFRLAKMGWSAGVISPPTMEEATAQIRPWVGQRSRWIKGFIQTLIVHLRGELPGGKAINAFGFFSVLGLAVFSAFSHAFLLAGIFICLLCWPFIGPTLSSFDIFLAVAGIGMAWLLLIVGSVTAQQKQSLWVIFGSIAYWPLQTWAALRAVSELFYKPFHWEKTDHGHSLERVCRQIDAEE